MGSNADESSLLALQIMHKMHWEILRRVPDAGDELTINQGFGEVESNKRPNFAPIGGEDRGKRRLRRCSRNPKR